MCRSLFEAHKLLFSFLMTIKIMMGDNRIDALEWRFCISGQTIKPLEMKNPAEDWIEANTWTEILSLGGLSDVFKGLPQAVKDDLAGWRKVYDSETPQSIGYPAPFDKLNGLQNLCILRVIRRDKLMDGVQKFVEDEMGRRYTEPPPFDLPACYDDSENVTPLVFILSTGSDPNKDIQELARNLSMEDKWTSIALGQGQGAIAEKLIEKSTKDGSWVLLQNCHLCVSWLPTLERIVEDFKPDQVHESFRLWLTSKPSPHFPVAVMQVSVKMTKEPPRGLRANLKTVFLKMDDDKLNRTNKPSDYRKLLFGLCFFHALIIERKKFGPLGWNTAYAFNETDLDICISQLELYVNKFAEIPFTVLSMLTSVVNYGGRINDDKDMRTADIIIADFLTPDILADSYKFSRSGIYKTISTDSQKGYLEYIDSLPMMPEPEVFGMHGK